MHQLNRDQYQSVIDALLKSAVFAGIVEDVDSDLDIARLKAMASTVRECVVECLAFGEFDEADIRELNVTILKNMINR